MKKNLFSKVLLIYRKIIKKLTAFFNKKYMTIESIKSNTTYQIHESVDFSPLAIVTRLKLEITGIVQAGAHYGQEIEQFLKHNPDLKIIAFEPNELSFSKLKEKFKEIDGVLVFKKALGSEIKDAEFWLASNDGQSSSLLRPSEHLQLAPHVKFDNIAFVSVETLDSYLSLMCDHNFLIIDTQGSELDVLIGAAKTLEHIEYIYVEVNRGEIYEYCTQFDELNNYLIERGFSCTHIRWFDKWGDAFYSKIL